MTTYPAVARRTRRMAIVCSGSFALAVFLGLSAALRAELRLEPVLQSAAPVVDFTFDERRLLVATLDGLIGALVENETSGFELDVILNLGSRVVGADGLGLWSLVIDETSVGPILYVHYAERETLDAVVSRFLPDELGGYRLEGEGVLLRIPKSRGLHYGGSLAFDSQGHLLIATGDSTGRASGPDPDCLAQSLDSLQGKVLRLDVSGPSASAPFYDIPPDNPFVESGRAEVWALGLRNPWRLSMDRETGDLWIADVGGDRREEIDFEPFDSRGGINYGWKRMEGTRCSNDVSGCAADLPPCGDPSYQVPLIEYSHQESRCSVIGGYVYRGRLAPQLYGRYLYGDLCSGEIWALERTSTASVDLGLRLGGLVAFGEDADGEIWVSSLDGIYRLAASDVPAGGILELESRHIEVAESAGTVDIGVVRVGGEDGATAVRVVTRPGSAGADEDYAPIDVVLSWPHGTSGRRGVTAAIVDDNLFEEDEEFEVRLELLDGATNLGARRSGTVTIVDDDPRCRGSAEAHCLSGGRFRASTSWSTAQGTSGAGQTRALTDETGAFWFFDESNLEIVVKVLDGCGVNGKYWVFATGLTDVEVRLEITDTETGRQRIYESQQGEPFRLIRDTEAFGACSDSV